MEIQRKWKKYLKNLLGNILKIFICKKTQKFKIIYRERRRTIKIRLLGINEREKFIF